MGDEERKMADEELSKEEELFVDEEHAEISTEIKAEDAEKKVDTDDKTAVSDEAKDESKTDIQDDKPTSVPLAALQDERRKRQALEDEVTNLRGQIPKSDEAPDPYEDIDAYNAYMRNKWEQENQASQAAVRNQRINKSRSKMLETVADYDEMERVFQFMTAEDPSLVEKMFASGNEAKFAYDTAKLYKESLLKPAEETKTELSDDEKRNKSALEMPNLATATAQAKNTETLEKEADIEDVFADVGY